MCRQATSLTPAYQIGLVKILSNKESKICKIFQSKLWAHIRKVIINLFSNSQVNLIEAKIDHQAIQFKVNKITPALHHQKLSLL